MAALRDDNCRMRILLVCVLLTSVAYADDATLRLTDVVRVAVRQSPELESARLAATSAEAAQLRAEGIQDIHVGATGTVEKQSNRPLLGGGTFSISRMFSTGGTFTLAVGTGRVLQIDPMTGAETTAYASSASVLAHQPLLRGAWPSAALAPVREAEHTHSAAVLAREARARDLIVALTIAYWRVALAAAVLDVRKASVALAEKQLAYTQGLIKTGKAPNSELLAVQQVLATRKQDVLASEQAALERSLELRQLAGLDIDANALGVTTEPLPTVTTTSFDMPTLVQAVFDHSAELASLVELERAAEAGVDGANGAARPRLDLDVAAGPVWTDTALASSFSSTPGYSVTASLTFDHAIQRRTERGGQGIARATRLQAKVDARAAKRRIAASAVRAIQRARAALEIVALAKSATDLAQQNIEAEQKRFELGKTTNFEVLRRQDELEGARLRYANAIVDYLSARAELDGLTGDVLRQHGIEIR